MIFPLKVPKGDNIILPVLVQVLGEAETKIGLDLLGEGKRGRSWRKQRKLAVCLLPAKECHKEGGMGREGLRLQ